MNRTLRKKLIDEGGRYTLSAFSFLAIGSAATVVASPLVATGIALAGTLYVFDKLKVTNKK